MIGWSCFLSRPSQSRCSVSRISWKKLSDFRIWPPFGFDTVAIAWETRSGLSGCFQHVKSQYLFGWTTVRWCHLCKMCAWCWYYKHKKYGANIRMIYIVPLFVFYVGGGILFWNILARTQKLKVLFLFLFFLLQHQCLETATNSQLLYAFIHYFLVHSGDKRPVLTSASFLLGLFSPGRASSARIGGEGTGGWRGLHKDILYITQPPKHEMRW